MKELAWNIKYQKHKTRNKQKVLVFRKKKLLEYGFNLIYSVKQANDTIKNDKILSKIYDQNDKDEFF